MSTLPMMIGVGLVTPLGGSVAENWAALLAGRSIADHARIAVDLPGEQPRVSRLAIRAAREAVGSCRPGDSDTALIVATSKGPVEEWIANDSSFNVGLCGEGLAGVASDVGRALEIRGPRLTISAACASGLHALIRAAMLIESGEARRALVVAAECSVHPLFIGSFDRLGVLPAGGTGCRPFDRQRDGFLMSEAAAAVLIEAIDQRPGAVMIERYALGADATHLTGTDPRACALRGVVRRVLDGAPVDLIHAHGTGTTANDPLELAVLDEASAGWSSPPLVYSHKGAIGHSLGAAGLVSVVINVMCHRQGMVPPNVNLREPLPTRHLRLRATATARTIHGSIALAMGFGGPIGAIRLTTKPMS